MKALIEMNAPKFVDTMFATAIIGSAHCPLHTAASALAITAAAVAQPIHTSAVHCAATAAVLGAHPTVHPTAAARVNSGLRHSLTTMSSGRPTDLECGGRMQTDGLPPLSGLTATSAALHCARVDARCRGGRRQLLPRAVRTRSACNIHLAIQRTPGNTACTWQYNIHRNTACTWHAAYTWHATYTWHTTAYVVQHATNTWHTTTYDVQHAPGSCIQHTPGMRHTMCNMQHTCRAGRSEL